MGEEVASKKKGAAIGKGTAAANIKKQHTQKPEEEDIATGKIQNLHKQKKVQIPESGPKQANIEAAPDEEEVASKKKGAAIGKGTAAASIKKQHTQTPEEEDIAAGKIQKLHKQKKVQIPERGQKQANIEAAQDEE